MGWRCLSSDEVYEGRLHEGDAPGILHWILSRGSRGQTVNSNGMKNRTPDRFGQNS